MALVPFHKMHGLGNDFVIFDLRDFSSTRLDYKSLSPSDYLKSPEIIRTGRIQRRARSISNRKTGIGCDQIICIIQPRNPDESDVSTIIINQDGSLAATCGNALRCVAKLVMDNKFVKNNLKIDIRYVISARDILENNDVGTIVKAEKTGDLYSVDMGSTSFNWEKIPLSHKENTMNIPLRHGVLNDGVAVNVGNPHIVFFLDDSVLQGKNLNDFNIPSADIEFFKYHELFVDGVNVNVAHILLDQSIQLRVFERGVGQRGIDIGETQACGSGACATAVAAYVMGKKSSYIHVNQQEKQEHPLLAMLSGNAAISERTRISLPGGDLHIDFSPNPDNQYTINNVTMTGPATYVFSGEIDLNNFAKM